MLKINSEEIWKKFVAFTSILMKTTTYFPEYPEYNVDLGLTLKTGTWDPWFDQFFFTIAVSHILFEKKMNEKKIGRWRNDYLF